MMTSFVDLSLLLVLRLKTQRISPPSCGYSKELSSSKSKGIPMKNKGELYNHIMVLCVGLSGGGVVYSN